MTVRQGLAFLALAVALLVGAAALTPRYEAPEKVTHAGPVARCGSDAECVAMFGPEDGQ